MILLDNLLGIQLPQAVPATDGTFWPTAGAALLHDLVETKWARLLPTLQDGAIVRKTRCDLRISQSQLAREARISQQMLAMIENGQRRITEPVMHKLWAAMWREHQARQLTPPGLELLVRLEGDLAVVTYEERV